MDALEPIHAHVDEQQARAALAAQQRRLFRISALVFVAFTVLVLGMFIASDQPWQTAPYLAIPPCALLTFVLVYRQHAKRARLACVETRYVISGEGFEVHSALGTQRASWRSFERFEEDEAMFVFYERGVVVGVLPKQPFAPADVARVRRLLDARIAAP